MTEMLIKFTIALFIIWHYGKSIYRHFSIKACIKKANLREIERKMKDHKSDNNDSPLLIATGRNYGEIVYEYIKYKKKQEEAALFHAIYKNNLEEMQRLIDAKVDIEAKCDSETLLMHAAWYGRTEAVKLLIKEGANIEAKDKWGFTALMYATEWAYAEAVKLLLEEGANKEARDNEGKTALDHAVEDGHTDIAEILERQNNN